MKKHPILLFILLILFTSCSTLKNEVKNTRGTPVGEPVLVAGFDLYDLRIGVIESNDTTANHHPLGFSLGHGLFYDLNGNLGFRVTELLGIAENEPFVIEKESSGWLSRDRTTYTRTADEFTVKSGGFFAGKDRVSIKVSGDETRVRSGLFGGYTIIRDGDDLIRKTTWSSDKLLKISNGYTHKKLLFSDKFTVKNNTVLLNKEYVLTYTGDEIRIARDGLWSSKPVFTVKKAGNTLYVYDRYYSGMKLVLSANAVDIYEHDKRVATYEKKR